MRAYSGRVTTPLRISGVSIALAAVLLTAGCGGSDDNASPTPTATTAPSPSPTTDSPTPTIPIPTAPTDGGTATCTTKQLAVTIAPSADGNAAGSSYSELVFTNKGPDTCSIYGWPGVSYVGDSNGTQIGAAADRTGSPKLLKLAKGKAAQALLREIDAGNFDDSCQIKPVDGVRVYPPNQKAAVFVAHKTQGCGAAATHTLVISPVVAR